jgi:hypothetical protein
MNNESTFESITDEDLDTIAGGRVHAFGRVARVGVVGRTYGVGYGYAAAYPAAYPATVPAIAPVATYPAAYPAYGYGAYGMRLGTAI